MLVGIVGIITGSGDGFCFACFNGAYPVDVPEGIEADKHALEGRAPIMRAAPGHAAMPRR